MAKRLQGLLAGVIIGALLAGGTVLGASTQRLDAVFNSIKLFVDGREITPKDATGKTVEPFMVNGTTYLPVRAVAEALGKQVSWDGATYSVYIGDMGGTLEEPALRLVDAVNIGRSWYKVYSKSDLTDHYGNEYESALYPNFTGDSSENMYETLLDMKYSRFKGTIYVPRGANDDGNSYISIEADGILLYKSPPITKTSQPVRFDIDISGRNDFKLLFEGTLWSSRYLGDAGFYQ
ncbi:MAG: NPCBM/NEW2 domain-containing protein [Oscillospiraceae bacterium]|jgi:hypothetical protein|nr:NPCBM/NEW2 domain-containing protein [Oscillospiraceae bacterium]